MLELNGEDAGGQFVRTALTLSILTHTPVTISNIRGDRPNPGLAPQHLSTLQILGELCDGSLSGAEIGAETVTFDPELAPSEHLPGGEFTVDIGTAGSVTLLLDAILPLATRIEHPISVTATGGTDVKWSPPVHYLSRVKCKVLRQFGLQTSLDILQHGFYPAGGGKVTLNLAPSTLTPIEIHTRGSPISMRVFSTESGSLSDASVAERQIEGVLDAFSAIDVPIVEAVTRTVITDSPGSSILVLFETPTSIAGYSQLGERGTPAETIGENVANEAMEYFDHTAPIDRHLADQLLVFLALAGGTIHVPQLTDHIKTSIELLNAFDITVEQDDLALSVDLPLQ